MPFHPDLAVNFIDEYMGYLQFHATVEILKSMCQRSVLLSASRY